MTGRFLQAPFPPKEKAIDKPLYKKSLIPDFNQLHSQESQEIPSEIQSESQFNVLALTFRNLTFTQKNNVSFRFISHLKPLTSPHRMTPLSQHFPKSGHRNLIPQDINRCSKEKKDFMVKQFRATMDFQSQIGSGFIWNGRTILTL